MFENDTNADDAVARGNVFETVHGLLTGAVVGSADGHGERETDLQREDRGEADTATLSRRGVLSSATLLGLGGLGATSGNATAARSCNNSKQRSPCAFIGKGRGNSIDRGSTACIGAGTGNRIFQGSDSFIGAGGDNRITGAGGRAVIGGGEGNRTNVPYTVVGGGRDNEAFGHGSVIAGGDGNQTNGGHDAIGGGQDNTTTGGTIAGGRENTTDRAGTAIGGGEGNEVLDPYATVGGGEANRIGFSPDEPVEVEEVATHATIGGGDGNEIGRSDWDDEPDPDEENVEGATVSGGARNVIRNRSRIATVGGGAGNQVGVDVEGAEPKGFAATIGGGLVNLVANDRGTVGGGRGNRVLGPNGTVGGGRNNEASAENTTVAGGENNVADGENSTVGGGTDHDVRGDDATVSGGLGNEIGPDAQYATIGGGNANEITDEAASATIAGGGDNHVTASVATVGGGANNRARNLGATVPGGIGNYANGIDSFAAGEGARANHSQTFVWNDAVGEQLESTGSQQFLVSARGGVGIGRNDPRTQLDVKADRAGELTPGNHVAAVENGSEKGTANVLALQTNVGTSGEEVDPTEKTHYVTFFDEDAVVGRIEGNGSGGVAFESGAGDVAEMLPLRDECESVEAGDVVGVHGGEISHETANADQVTVVSSTPIVVGNASPDAAGPREPVAFVGQVATRVRGPVGVGDLVVPSGDGDGDGVAVDPADWDPVEHGPVVGQAWEADATDGVSEVTLAVGLGAGAHAAALARRRNAERGVAETAELRQENAALRDRVDALEARLDALESRGPDGRSEPRD